MRPRIPITVGRRAELRTKVKLCVGLRSRQIRVEYTLDFDEFSDDLQVTDCTAIAVPAGLELGIVLNNWQRQPSVTVGSNSY